MWAICCAVMTVMSDEARFGRGPYYSMCMSLRVTAGYTMQLLNDAAAGAMLSDRRLRATTLAFLW